MAHDVNIPQRPATPLSPMPPRERNHPAASSDAERAYHSAQELGYELSRRYADLERAELDKEEPNPVLVYAFQAAASAIGNQLHNLRRDDCEGIGQAAIRWLDLLQYARKDDPVNKLHQSAECQALVGDGYSEEQAVYLLLMRGKSAECREAWYPEIERELFPDDIPGVTSA